MEQLNINSYPSVVDAIDNKNIVEIEKLSKNINKSNKNDKGNQKDIILKLYNNQLLTLERFRLIIKDYKNYFNISSNLIKKINKG